MNKRLSELEVTPHAKIIDEWYKAMESNKISVQPKAATILGTILAKFDIDVKSKTRDIWAEALTIKGGEFPGWYASLSKEEQLQYEFGRRHASEKHDPRNKSLLKG